MPVTMHPIRTRFVPSAIAARCVQPSKTSPVGPAPPIEAKWSKVQHVSKPASSAICQTCRRSAIVVCWGASFKPIRNAAMQQ